MSGIGQDPKEVRKGAIWSEDNALREVLKAISERLDSLACRLKPILSAPTPPSPEKDKAEEAAPDLVERLRSRNTTAHAIEAGLVSLLERLEI